MACAALSLVDHDLHSGTHRKADGEGQADPARPIGFAARGEHMGIGLVGRVLGSIGIGNIGAELFRLAKPFDMKFIAHDPFADARLAADSVSNSLVSTTSSPAPNIVTVNCPLTAETRYLVNGERLALMRRPPFSSNCARTYRRSKGAHGRSGKRADRGAALDVFDQETDRSGRSSFRARQNVIR